MTDAILDRPMAVTNFRDFTAATKTEEMLSPRALAERVRTVTAPRKADLPWLKLARFGDQRTAKSSLRHDANVLGISGLEADYDAGKLDFDAAYELLEKQGVAAMIYTSPSNTEDAPRWRVLCPLSAEMLPGRRRQLLGRLNGLFRGVFSRESWALSQAYYYGSVGSNSSHKVELIEGAAIDEHDDLDEIWIGPGNVPVNHGEIEDTGGDEREMAELVRRALTGEELHTALAPLAARLVGRSVPRDAAAEILRGIMLAWPEPSRNDRWRHRYAEIGRLVDSALAKFAEPAAARREHSRRLASYAVRLLRSGIDDRAVLQRLDAANATSPAPLPADRMAEIAVWAAQKAGAAHAAR